MQTHVNQTLTFFYSCFRGWGWLIFGGSTEDAVEQYFLLVLYGKYWWGGEVCSSGHGVGKRGCFRFAWSFVNINWCLTVNSVTLYCAPVRLKW
jgi:hypothetical protein